MVKFSSELGFGIETNAKTIHMIGNAHIDPVWLWQSYEGMQEIKATFRSALERLEEFDEFIFTASSAAFYDWVEQNEPEMFAEIQKYVAAGRWELAGGWWVEPDCNIPGGEALVRQALFGQRYFMSRFGKRIRVGYNPDSFGHNATLPQILKRSGFHFYIFMRPGPHENNQLSDLFWWEASDGSQILTYRIPFSYTVWGDSLEAHIKRCYESTAQHLENIMCFYGVGNHGGGPTIGNIKRILELKNKRDFPGLLFSTTEKFFSKYYTHPLNLPIVRDELQHHASGCYAAHSGVKQWNRQAENALIVAEKWASIATWMTGLTYPKNELEKAWKLVLFNQFHDILAGTSIESAYQDAQNTYSSAVATADGIRNAALQKLSWNVATPERKDGQSVIIFNPHPWTSSVPVEVELGWFEGTSYIVKDVSGNIVESQNIHPHTSTTNSQRLCFTTQLPSLGYNTYQILKEKPGVIQPRTDPRLPLPVIENQWFVVEFDTSSGAISRLYDKANRCEVIKGAAAKAVVIDDQSDTWSHGVFRYDNEVGMFSDATFSLKESGPVKTTLRVSSQYRDSCLVQEFTIYESIPRILVHVTVDWHEQHNVLKLCFPINITNMVATYETPYGHIIRPANGDEEAAQRWVDVSGIHSTTEAPYGVSVLNDGKYSYSVTESEIRLTVLRSPIYAHHTPYVPNLEGIYTYVDQGVQRFSYAVLPHAGTWKQSHTVRHAAELNQPAFTIKESYHPWGKLPTRLSFLSVTPENIVISVLKQAEDNDDMILRCVETQNCATKAIINAYGFAEPITVNLMPNEIKTLRFHWHQPALVTEVNLLEEDIEEEGIL